MSVRVEVGQSVATEAEAASAAPGSAVRPRTGPMSGYGSEAGKAGEAERAVVDKVVQVLVAGQVLAFVAAWTKVVRLAVAVRLVPATRSTHPGPRLPVGATRL